MISPAKSPVGLFLLLGMVGASMSLFADTVIGALPVLQAALGARDRDAQQLVSLFTFAAAVMALFVGALADAYGRRPMVLGSLLLLGPLLRRYPPRTVLVAGYGTLAAAIAVNLAVGALGIRILPVVLAPIALFSVGIGCTLPLLLGEALEPFPDNAGMASSCQMFLQYVLMGVTAGVLAPLAWDSLFDLAVAHAGMVSLGVVLLVWQKRVAQKEAVRRTTLRGP